MDGLLGVRNPPALDCKDGRCESERGGVCMTVENSLQGDTDPGVERGWWRQSIANYSRYVPAH